jgi:5'/3'-nucleotidase
VQILLTNDDGVFAPGLRALRAELQHLGDVIIVAPALEQSGVGHSITLLAPLIVKQVEEIDGSTLGWMVEGSPADSVKLGICELMPRPPDLVVSGINAGANAGINVLYSGTVAAAIEGAFFKITSIAVSLEISEHFDYPRAARHARMIIEQILEKNPVPGALFNVNLPASSRGEPKGVRVVPMSISRHGEAFERRKDPRGRTYYWTTYSPPYNLEGPESDVTSLSQGYITVTPLHFDLTHQAQLTDIATWDWKTS